MDKKAKERGQVYSLDFLISAGLIVLSIGLVLGMYEMSANQSKETRMKNELDTIATSASNVLLEKAKCSLDNTGGPAQPTFQQSGYKVLGCAKAPAPLPTKKQLMIPPGFSCRAKLKSGATETDVTAATDGCRSDPATDNPSDIISIERQVLNPNAAALTKQAYEKCINGPACPLGNSPTDTYSETTLVLKVWRA